MFFTHLAVTERIKYKIYVLQKRISPVKRQRKNLTTRIQPLPLLSFSGDGSQPNGADEVNPTENIQKCQLKVEQLLHEDFSIEWN